MSANYHTDVAAGASASAATVNSPLGQLDSHVNPTVQDTGTFSGSATVTTAGTYYFVTGIELAFTPAFTGQVFLVTLSGYWYASAAGQIDGKIYYTDGSNVAVNDHITTVSSKAAAANHRWNCSSTAGIVAPAGDVGVTRKVRLMVTHSSNGAVVTCPITRLQVISH